MSLSVAIAEHLKKWRSEINRSWILVWLILSLLLSTSLILSQNYQYLWLVWAQAALAIFAQWLLVFPRSWIARGLFFALISTTLISIFSWFFNANGFYETDQFWTSVRKTALTGQVIKGQGNQNWQVEPDEPLVWTFEAKLLEGQSGWDWRQPGKDIELLRMQDKAGIFTRASAAESSEELYLSRQFQFESSIKDRTFKFYLGLRSPQGASDQVYISSTGGDRLPVSITEDWRLFQAEWTAKVDAEQIRILLRNLNGLELDIRELRLLERVDNAWLDLGSGFGSEMRVLAKTTDNSLLIYQDFMPSNEWQSYSFEIPASGNNILNTSILLGEGFQLQLRNSKLSYSSNKASAPRLISRDTRQKLWFSNENFMAHSVTAAGMVFLLTVNSLSLSVLGYIALLITVVLSGSRTALLVACIGGWLLLTLLFKRKQSMKLYYGLLFFASIFLITSFIRFGPDSLAILGLNTNQVVSRLDIWQVAWNSFLAYPLTGLPQQDFGSYFSNIHPELPDTLHAHNFWLDFASRYGIFGLLASFLLTAYFIFYGWKKGQWTGLILILSFLVLQLFDVTLLFSGVLLFLILGLNSLAKLPNRPEGSSSEAHISDKPL